MKFDLYAEGAGKVGRYDSLEAAYAAARAWIVEREGAETETHMDIDTQQALTWVVFVVTYRADDDGEIHPLYSSRINIVMVAEAAGGESGRGHSPSPTEAMR